MNSIRKPSPNIGQSDPFLIQVGKRIHNLRVEKGITQKKLATTAGIHHTYISHIESGHSNVRLDKIEKIAEALKISILELFRF